MKHPSQQPNARHSIHSRFARWIKALAFLLPTVLIVVAVYRFTDFPRRLALAASLVSVWNLVEAESSLASLVEDYPEKIESQNLRANTLLKRGELRSAREQLGILLREDSLIVLTTCSHSRPYCSIAGSCEGAIPLKWVQTSSSPKGSGITSLVVRQINGYFVRDGCFSASKKLMRVQ